MRRGVERLPSRREIIAAGAASVLTLSGGLGVAAPVVAAGTVFHDRRGTGTRMPGDPGIAGVMVSNGRDVVLTDFGGALAPAGGRWRRRLPDQAASLGDADRLGRRAVHQCAARC